jgi:hypothetical protein
MSAGLTMTIKTAHNEVPLKHACLGNTQNLIGYIGIFSVTPIQGGGIPTGYGGMMLKCILEQVIEAGIERPFVECNGLC